MNARGDWRSKAACRDAVDPDLFFPAVEVGPLCAGQIEQARAVCAQCPVRAECLRWALDGLHDGIAGGLTSEERIQLRAGERKERRRGGSRGTSRISRTNPNPLAGTRATEGHRG